MIKIKELLQSFSRLSPQQKKIIFPAAGGLFVVLVLFGVVVPIVSKIGSLNREIKEKQDAINNDVSVASRKDDIAREMKVFGVYLGEVEAEDEEASRLRKEVENLANMSSVSINDLKPAGMRELGGIKVCLVNISCEAQMEQLIQFMYSIENSEKLLTVQRYEITPKSKDSSLAQCAMTVAKVLIP